MLAGCKVPLYSVRGIDDGHGGGPSMKRSSKGVLSRRVTLSDVARAAGVSVMTVSNVINGKQAGVVGGETANRVQREVERLGYRPHPIARNLRLARSTTVGLAIVTADPLIMAAPFIATMVSGVAASLSQSGYNLITETVHPQRFGQAELLHHSGIAGFVAHLAGAPAERAEYQQLLLAMGLPIVFIQDRALATLRDCLIINQDDFKGGVMLAEHLIGCGARRLLYVRSAVDWPAVMERERGIRSVLGGKRGVELGVVRVENEGIDSTQQILRAHFRKSGFVPDAIVCSNDHLAAAALKLIQAIGRQVPDDVNITGFNNFEYRNFTTPTLTTVQSQIYRMGVEAGTQLTNRLTHGSFSESEKLFPVSLVLGGSTGMRRVPAAPKARRRIASVL
jgi:LacI family transcriptional regulator